MIRFQCLIGLQEAIYSSGGGDGRWWLDTEQNRAASMRLGSAGGQGAILLVVAGHSPLVQKCGGPWSCVQFNAPTRTTE